VIWWIGGAVVGVALVVFGVAVGLLLSRLREVKRLGRRLQVSATDAQSLLEPITALQQRAEAMQEQVLTMERHISARRAAKG